MADDAMRVLLSRLLREAPAPLAAGDDVAEWWRRFCAERPAWPAPIDRAVFAGFRADRLAGALAGGYQAALRVLVPGVLADGDIASLCVTEQAGNAPRDIASRLTPRAGGYALDGRKRWSTMAPLARMLLVAATEGTDAAGKSRIRLVRVTAHTPGVAIRPMPATRFVPEVPHAEIDFTAVAVAAEAPLPGDGYATYVKRFRTLEDIHIHGAVLGYVLSVARRFAFPPTVLERLASAVVVTRALAAMDPDAPETHVALAGTLARDATLLEHSQSHWSAVDAGERERWDRDRAMFGAVAGRIREARTRRAWERLAAGA